MNFSLLDSILRTRDGVLATIIGASGHTYKKTGQQALYAPGGIEPVHGNLGALCADQEIIARADEARASEKPLTVTIDTTGAMDELMGSGTGCGGTLTLLLEPIGPAHKRTYAQLGAHLKSGPAVFLVHDTETGDLRVETGTPRPGESLHIERIAPLTPLVLFGATPLARRIAALAADMDFVVHLADWRPAFLDLFRSMPGIEIQTRGFSPPPDACVVLMSHSFQRDLAALRDCLGAGCRYVGVLSSRSRRDRMFAALAAEGVSANALSSVHSPVGLDIGAQTDAEIAVAILAEIIGTLRA
ncbi:MAG: XdhC family protein [Candidatus Krumholzibacteria bacterium]|nr:XdhC family protein [Candidatus Krumholzibacteria bacterium]MDH5270279.1 XdhC family protein [Candidatus Krumholzibacteria bacterium]